MGTSAVTEVGGADRARVSSVMVIRTPEVCLTEPELPCSFIHPTNLVGVYFVSGTVLGVGGKVIKR